jgi:hypothetical protein
MNTQKITPKAAKTKWIEPIMSILVIESLAAALLKPLY